MVYLLLTLELSRIFFLVLWHSLLTKGFLWGQCSKLCFKECICFRDKSLKGTCRWQESQRRESQQLPRSPGSVVIHPSHFAWENSLLCCVVLFAPCCAPWALLKCFSESGYIMTFKQGVVITHKKNIDCNSCFISVKSLPWKHELRQIYEYVIFNISLG